MVYMSHSGLSILQSLILSVAWAVVYLCANHHLLQTEVSLMWVRDTLICGGNDKSLGSGLSLYSLSKLIIVGFVLRPMTYLAMHLQPNNGVRNRFPLVEWNLKSIRK